LTVFGRITSTGALGLSPDQSPARCPEKLAMENLSLPASFSWPPWRLSTRPAASVDAESRMIF
jgi:hypothetical protein